MIRVPFRDVMEGVLGHCGQKFDSTLADQQSILATFINLRVQEGWTFGPWFDIALCEERAFAENWNESKAYVIGEIVYVASSNKYYEALTDNTNSTPATHPADWQADVDPGREIANQQYGAEKIGRVWKVASRNPRKYREFKTFEHSQTATGTNVLDCALNTVWVYFSNPSPRFTGKAYSQAAASTYTRGTIVFYPGTESDIFPNTGECYRADLDVDGKAIWVLIPFPEVLQRFVISSAAGDMQRYYGKSEEATDLENEAYVALYDEARKNGIGSEVIISGR
jgi:hypothetical protein